MAGTITTNAVVLGDSGTASQNFQLKTGVDGTAKLARGATGTLGDILTVDASGNVNTTNALTQGSVAVPRMVLATAQNTTSGTSIDFTGIPSWAKQITFIMNGVSASGVNHYLLQLGSGSIVTSGYLSNFGYFISDTNANSASSTAGLGWWNGAAADTQLGQFRLNLISGNTWVSSLSGGSTGGASVKLGGGNITLSGTLDRIRLTTVNGTDTFDAGSVNILYEG